MDETEAAAPTEPQQTPEGTEEKSLEVGQAEADKQKDEVDSFTKINPETLPDELKGVYKSMLADYTRKTQAAAQVRSKAEAFDDLASNPTFSTVIDNLSKYGNPLGPQEEAPTGAQKGGSELSGEDVLTMILDNPKDFFKMMRDIATEVTTAEVKPIREDFSERSATNTLNKLQEKYPDLLDFEEDIIKTIDEKAKQGMNIGVEESYLIVTHGKVSKAKESLEKREQGAQPNGNRTSAITPKTAKTLQEAYANAKKAHGQ
jgi:hypothetical protein